jgi:GNAT superfamily N-acetyltransferase
MLTKQQPAEPDPALPKPEIVLLEDGTQAIIRPIRLEDAYYLQAGFLRLSEQSIYFRFLTHKKALTDEEALEFARVDYTTRMAFVATCEEGGEQIVVGVARYVQLPETPEVAEAAVIVGDEYQRRGIGWHLMNHLVAYARLQGLRYLRGVINVENNLMMDGIQRSGYPFERHFKDGAGRSRSSVGGWVDIIPKTSSGAKAPLHPCFQNLQLRARNSRD